MTNGRVIELARRIARHNDKAEDLVRDIRESDHPLAGVIADALANECLALNDAYMTASDLLADLKWEAENEREGS